jgi:hypothetical protein
MYEIWRLKSQKVLLNQLPRVYAKEGNEGRGNSEKSAGGQSPPQKGSGDQLQGALG